MTTNANPYLLAADNSPLLLPLLRSNPSLASAQDAHGYSLIHAAASYNHLDLLRTLICEFNLDVNLCDEDGETALFVVETVDAARCLVEDLHIDALAKNGEQHTAREKLEEEGDFRDVVLYLRGVEGSQGLSNGTYVLVNGASEGVPTPPEALAVTVGTMSAEEEVLELDPEFRRRIEEMAARDDFDTEAGQAELRQLVRDAVADGEYATDGRNVRPRQD